jgi:hypothetical protein
MNQPAQIRGPAVSSFFHWVTQAYGPDLLSRALLKISLEDRAHFDKLIISLGWYPVAAFERLIDATYKEVANATGESRETFDKRGVQEGGGALMKTIYKFVMSMSSPQNTIARLPTIYPRVYDQGKLEVLQNEPGHCIFRHEGPEEMYPLAIRNLHYGLPYTLALVGAKNPIHKFLKDEHKNDRFLMENDWSYS